MRLLRRAAIDMFHKFFILNKELLVSPKERRSRRSLPERGWHNGAKKVYGIYSIMNAVIFIIVLGIKICPVNDRRSNGTRSPCCFACVSVAERDQLHVKDQRAVGRYAAGLAFAIGQMWRDEEPVFTARRHQL